MILMSIVLLWLRGVIMVATPPILSVFLTSMLDAVERNLRDLSEHESGWQGCMQSALQGGRGALLVSAHFGNWDMAGVILARHHTVSAVAETFSDEQLNQLLQDQRREKGIGIIPLESSMRPILRILQQNQLAAIIVDRPMPANQGH